MEVILDIIMIEIANRIYYRTYTEVSSRPHPNGELLTFKGQGVEMSILDSELEFHVRRAEDALKPKKEYDKKEVPADLIFHKPFYGKGLEAYKLIGVDNGK